MGLIGNFFNHNTGTGSDGTRGTATPPAAPQITGEVVPPAPPPPQNGGTPVASPAPTAAPAPGSQLDAFKGLWQTPTDKDGKPIVHTNPLAAPVFQIDPTKVAESAAKMDFTAGIAPELVAKALGGDQAAFAEALNTAMRNVVIGLSTNNGNLINQAILENNQRLLTTLPTEVKRVQLNQQPVDNPVLEHPAVQPLLNALKAAEFAKNPGADPATIHANVTNYLTSFAKVLGENDPTVVAAQQKTAAAEVDWTKWVGQ